MLCLADQLCSFSCLPDELPAVSDSPIRDAVTLGSAFHLLYGYNQAGKAALLPRSPEKKLIHSTEHPLSNEGLTPVRIWLVIVALVVAVMVLVGGATRLTDSGLSITEWAPISGAIPPLTKNDWVAAFLEYQVTTEFKTINKNMTLEEFKFIFWWEWGHRFLGRMIGLIFAIPLAWFWFTGRLTPWLKPRLLVLLALGGLQGFIGWWMVKSGLVGRVDVSQIRLAIHLTLACIIFAMTIWILRSITRHDGYALPGHSWQAALLFVLVLVQIFLGGLVAGLDAGMAFNTWPNMNGHFVPEGIWAIEPLWRNFVDNATTVQFVHRITAYVLWGVALLHAINLHRLVRSSTHSKRAIVLFLLITAQAVLGIITLVLQVPLEWGLLHQFGALVVLAFAVSHWRAFTINVVKP